MMRYFAAGTLAVIVLLAAWAFAPGRGAPDRPVKEPESSALAGASAAPAADSVRIEQRLVHVRAVAGERVKTPGPALNATHNTTRRAGFLTRAHRVLFGEGRHKPAPFPTVQ
jgi:hypothetical protein